MYLLNDNSMLFISHLYVIYYKSDICHLSKPSVGHLGGKKVTQMDTATNLYLYINTLRLR